MNKKYLIKVIIIEKLNILLNRNWLWSVLLFELGTLQLMFLLIRFNIGGTKKNLKPCSRDVIKSPSWIDEPLVSNKFPGFAALGTFDIAIVILV